MMPANGPRKRNVRILPYASACALGLPSSDGLPSSSPLKRKGEIMAYDYSISKRLTSNVPYKIIPLKNINAILKSAREGIAFSINMVCNKI